MIGYPELREQAQDGDVLLCKSRGLVSIVIRVVTGESYNHVAVLIWMGPSLYVFEMLEGQGHLITPASEWFGRRKGLVWWGQAPVRGCPSILPEALRQRGKRYGWWTLPRVWWSQITRSGGSRQDKVCSTYAQHLWEVAGYGGFRWPADPGDIAEHCASLVPVSTGAGTQVKEPDR